MRPTEKLRRHAKFRSMGGGSKFNLRQRFMLVLFVAVWHHQRTKIAPSVVWMLPVNLCQGCIWRRLEKKHGIATAWNFTRASTSTEKLVLREQLFFRDRGFHVVCIHEFLCKAASLLFCWRRCFASLAWVQILYSMLIQNYFQFPSSWIENLPFKYSSQQDPFCGWLYFWLLRRIFIDVCWCPYNYVSSGRGFPYIDKRDCSLLAKVVVQIQLLVALHLPSLSDHEIASNRFIACEGILRSEKNWNWCN